MTIDWHYHRPGCVTCKRMQAFLEERDLSADEQVNATKIKYSGDEALKIVRKAKVLVIAKGKKVVEFDLEKDKPDTETLEKHVLGPTGNLRAPVVTVGSTMFIGFNDEAFAEHFAELA